MDNIFQLTTGEAKKYLEEEGCADFLVQGIDNELNPEWDDLARLYKLVRDRKPFKILEFGSGFSTLVMAFALKKNWKEYVDLNSKKGIKESDLKFGRPHLVALESSKKWKENSINKIKSVEFDNFADIVFSEIEIAEYDGQICHFYRDLPNIVPDFIYLDGPDPLTVKGDINGLSFQNIKRTVMAADPVKYESTLLPGFFMIVDGRSNNSRFLKRILKRKYEVNYHKEADVTTFELSEDRLGRKNIFGWEAYNNMDIYFANDKIN